MAVNDFSAFLAKKSFDQEDRWLNTPVHSQATLEEAQKASFEEGYRAGEQDGKHGRLGQCYEVLGVVESKIDAFLSHQEHYWEPLQDQLAQALHGAIKLSIQAASRHISTEILTEFIHTALVDLKNKSRVVIMVHPERVDEIRAHFINSASSTHPSAPNLEFQGDGTLGLIDCRLDFEVGGIQMLQDHLESELEACFTAYRQNLTHKATLIAQEPPHQETLPQDVSLATTNDADATPHLNLEPLKADHDVR